MFFFETIERSTFAPEEYCHLDSSRTCSRFLAAEESARRMYVESDLTKPVSLREIGMMSLPIKTYLLAKILQIVLLVMKKSSLLLS